MKLIEKLSFRDTAKTISRFLHLSEETSLRHTTLEDRVESVGRELSNAYESKAEEILEANQIDKASGIIDESSTIPSAARNPDLPALQEESHIRKLITDYNRGRDSLLKLKFGEQTSNIEADPNQCCYIRIDDVGVKFQKEKRNGKCLKSKKYVENTVIHIQMKDEQYSITAIGMDKAFWLLIAFLLENKLMENRRLIFLTDGATNIKDRIEKYFAFRDKTIVLDWLHLEKKCHDYMSMAVKGTKTEKEELKKTLTAILWTGRTDKAVQYLSNIKSRNIKNNNILEDLKNYILRKSNYIIGTDGER